MGTNLNGHVSTHKISHNSYFWLIQTVDSTTVFFPYRSCFHLVVEDGLGRGQEGKAPAVCSQEDLEHRWNCESPKSKVGRTERTKNALLLEIVINEMRYLMKSADLFANTSHDFCRCPEVKCYCILVGCNCNCGHRYE